MFPNCIEEERIHYSSMVGPFISLKGRYPRYKQLEHQMADLWDCPRQLKFRTEKIKED